MAKNNPVPFGERTPEQMSFQDFLDRGVVHITDIDDVLAVDQEELLDVPFILYEWDVKPSAAYGGEYVVCRVKTQDGTRVFADGGTGIGEQLERYKETLADRGEQFSPIYFPHGLRKSTYQKELENGGVVTATTYYFDNRN